MQWLVRCLQGGENVFLLYSVRKTLVENVWAKALMLAQCAGHNISLRSRILLLEIIRVRSSGVFGVRHDTPNENKMSDGGRERASLGVEVWKSSQKWSVQRSAVRSIAWLGLIALV